MMNNHELFDCVTDALGKAVDDDVLTVDMMEVLSALIAIMAMEYGMSAPRLLYCFSSTVANVYEEEDYDDDETPIH